MRPGAQVGTSPLRICRSVPQMVVLSILTTASVGEVMSGVGRSSSAILPGAWYTSAFILLSLRSAGAGIVRAASKRLIPSVPPVVQPDPDGGAQSADRPEESHQDD